MKMMGHVGQLVKYRRDREHMDKLCTKVKRCILEYKKEKNEKENKKEGTPSVPL
jgi:hypothetical protein